MKKTKLLMPILGVSAVVAGATPAIVSCTPGGETTDDQNISVKILPSAEAQLAGDLITLTSDLPEVEAGKEYKTNVTWVQWNVATGLDAANSRISSMLIYDKNLNVVEPDAGTGFKDTGIGKAEITISKALAKPGMRIVLYTSCDDVFLTLPMTNYSETITLESKPYYYGKGMYSDVIGIDAVLAAAGNMQISVSLDTYQKSVYGTFDPVENPGIVGQTGFYVWVGDNDFDLVTGVKQGYSAKLSTGEQIKVKKQRNGLFYINFGREITEADLSAQLTCKFLVDSDADRKSVV